MSTFKENYNKLLAREKRAEAYFDNPNIPIEEKEKYIPNFNCIIRELSKLIYEYKTTTGGNPSEEVIFDGFK